MDERIAEEAGVSFPRFVERKDPGQQAVVKVSRERFRNATGL
jgi:hypothetical protein